MRLITENVAGNVHQAIMYINSVGRAPYLHQLINLNSSGCIAIYKVERYYQYVQMWGDLRHNPDTICTEEEFNQTRYLS